MRSNRSGNVNPDCSIHSLAQVLDPDCCPVLQKEGYSYNLRYLGSAYPETLRCMAAVGCEGTTVYSNLFQECLATCPLITHQDQFGRTICLAQFNSAHRFINVSITVVTISVFVFFIVL